VTTAGIVLCGGKSSRMGTSKAMLPFGPETMLQRVVRRMLEAVPSLVVVAAPGQELPPLPDAVRVVRDHREGRGPLEGLFAGLSALSKDVSTAYATSCDVPLLTPAFVLRMLALLEDHDVAVPRTDGFFHPLAAAYRSTVLPHVEELLAADRLRPVFLFERVRTREITADELHDVGLDSLQNLNTPEEYQAALASFEAR
jgi:molybdopterin-guanine dinucleotide biosynthesis protein A